MQQMRRRFCLYEDLGAHLDPASHDPTDVTEEPVFRDRVSWMLPEAFCQESLLPQAYCAVWKVGAGPDA